MRGAISASRRTAFLQWCRSHMSQTMIAVFFGSQDSATVTTRYSLVFSLDSTRFCSVSLRSSAALSEIEQSARMEPRKRREAIERDGFMRKSLANYAEKKSGKAARFRVSRIVAFLLPLSTREQ